ncbi:MAG: Hsp33 family molecular chaperone [Rhizobiales bacterium]|nr:Hsp33 family molecular chaperone [Hyphomicrobiales bacterium]
MSESASLPPGAIDASAAGDDIVIPFSIVGNQVRGRLVRLGALITDIIARHDYPPPVSRLLGETVALTALLGTGLKFDGRFILQANTDGPVDLLVAEFSTPGLMRAYAHFDAGRIPDGPGGEVPLLGAGNLAMTIDQGAKMERYQGVVPLEGGDLAQAAHIYFRQSEQIPTELHLGAGEISTPPFDETRPAWRAGGILIQHLPVEGGHAVHDDADSWNRARHLLDTVRHDELLDPMLAPERLLYRLFHEDGVRTSPAKPLTDRCHCSRERVETLLHSFEADDIASMIEDGRIKVTCEFCSATYEFEPDAFTGANSGSD